ncbi:MAG: sialidase family protein, partial [Nitrosopumilaceae archaeon]
VNSEGSSVTTPQVSVSGDNVYVVWREFEQKRWHLSFAKSNDGGNTFDKPITLNTDPNSIDTVWSTGSHIFAHNDSVYVIWPEEYWDGENQTFKTWYAKSDDAGNTFDVALHPLNEKRSKYGDIITLEDSGILYFVVPTFKNPPYNDPALYFAKNSDNGNTLTKAIDLLENTVPAFGLPKIAIKENSIQIVSGGDYNKNCILYLTSSDGGMSFTSPVNLSPNGNSKDCLGIQEFVPSPLQQLKMGINSEDVKCKEVRDKGYLLGLRQRNNFPVCVTVNSYEDLLSRGFLASDSFETLALMAAEKFVISSPTFSFDGIPNSLDLDIDTVRKSIPPVV